MIKEEIKVIPAKISPNDRGIVLEELNIEIIKHTNAIRANMIGDMVIKNFCLLLIFQLLNPYIE